MTMVLPLEDDDDGTYRGDDDEGVFLFARNFNRYSFD
jgi:hypothetical protein